MIPQRAIERDDNKILTESYPLLMKVLGCNADGIWEWDVEHNQIQWVVPIDDLFGFTSSITPIDFEFLHEHIIHPEDRTKYLAAIDQCIKTGEFSVEVRCIGKNNDLIWIASKGCCIYNRFGAATKMMGMMTDITDQKKVEEELHHLSLAVENAMTGIAWLDTEGTFQIVREGYAKMLQYRPEELIGKSWKEVVPISHHKYGADSYLEMLEQGKTEVELLGLKKDGSIFYKQLLMVKTFDHNGKHNGNYCFMRDIDERKGFEKEIQDQNSELKQINRELDNFVYRVSHDLRAPLSSTLGLVELCLNSNDTDEIKSYLGLQQKSLRKLDSFIQDILDYSRNNQKEIDYQAIDLNEQLDEVLQLNKEYKEVVTRHVEIDQKSKFVSDPMRVRILLNNLISNAFKFSQPNKSEGAQVTIKLEIDENFAKIEIADNGIGIGEAHLDRIFEMFYRATDYKSGSGIGLYIVHESVRKLGGTIKVRSTERVGTSFFVILPNNL